MIHSNDRWLSSYGLCLFCLVLCCWQSDCFGRQLGTLYSQRYSECQCYLQNDCNSKKLVYLAIVYSHDVIETNDNFNLLEIGERLTPVFLQIAVTLLNKCLSQNIKINNLFINIESWSTFVKLVDNSAIKKTILSRMWRNLEFPRNRSIFFWLFLFFFVSSSLVSVVSLSTTWTFASNLKELVISGLSVSSISSGAINYV